MTKSFDRLLHLVEAQAQNPAKLVERGGIITALSRSAFHVRGLDRLGASLGDRVVIDCGDNQLDGEIVQLDETQALVKPYDENIVPKLGAGVFPQGALLLRPDLSWRGRVVNAQGLPIDGQGALIQGADALPVDASAVPALQRGRVGTSLRTGVNVIDIFTPLVFGQRMGIFAILYMLSNFYYNKV